MAMEIILFTIVAVLLLLLWLSSPLMTSLILVKAPMLVTKSVLWMINLGIFGLLAWGCYTGDFKIIKGHAHLLMAVIVVQASYSFLIGIAYIIKRIRAMWKDAMQSPLDKGRRALIKHAIVFPVAAVALTEYGSSEAEELKENFYDIPIGTLPIDMDGVKISQISDVHLGINFSLERLKNLLDVVSLRTPDMLVMTGDIFDDDSMTKEAVSIIDSFADRFPMGIWFCYGNHEHYRNMNLIQQCLNESRINVLRNESSLIFDDGKQQVYMCGADYPMKKDGFYEEKDEIIKQTMDGIPKESVKILLAHHPEFIDDAQVYRISLVLSGHTHGCQVGIFGYPLLPFFKYNRGMYLGKDFCGYVHSGNGSWFPFRWGCPPEIAYFTLKQAR